MHERTCDDDASSHPIEPKTSPEGKKPYRSPRLTIYGDLRHLTTITKGPGTERGNPRSKAAL